MNWWWFGLGVFVLLLVAMIALVRSQRLQVIYRVERAELEDEAELHGVIEIKGYAGNREAAYAMGRKVQRLSRALHAGIEHEKRSGEREEVAADDNTLIMTRPPD